MDLFVVMENVLFIANESHGRNGQNIIHAIMISWSSTPIFSAEAGKTKVLFVKNLSFDTTGESLGDAFEGSSSARVATHADSGKSKG